VEAVINSELGIRDYELDTDCKNQNSKLKIHFSSPVWGVTPGQSLVLYKDGLVVGGGVIER
jgi:tRNA U34 2-thiouridine synthase MnmA/TrmU